MGMVVKGWRRFRDVGMSDDVDDDEDDDNDDDNNDENDDDSTFECNNMKARNPALHHDSTRGQCKGKGQGKSARGKSVLLEGIL